MNAYSVLVFLFLLLLPVLRSRLWAVFALRRLFPSNVCVSRAGVVSLERTQLEEVGLRCGLGHGPLGTCPTRRDRSLAWEPVNISRWIVY